MAKSLVVETVEPTSHFRATTVVSLPEAEDILMLFERVAVEEGWHPGGEIRAYGARSTFFALGLEGNSNPEERTREPAIVAGLQLVRPDGAGQIPSHQVWPELAIGNPQQAVHIAMLAVDKDWRGKAGGVFWLLTAQMWNHCVRNGIQHLWLEATPRTLRCYQRLGWPCKVVGELREHWGEPCYPCYLSVREVAGALAERAVHSHSYQDILANMVGMQQA